MKRHGMGFLCAASVTLACTTGAGADAPAPGMRSHNSKIKTTDSMMDTAGSMMVGACCFPSTACLDITESECMSQGGEFRAGLSCVKPALGAPGIYALRNHPDNHLTPPEYGMRLDELFDVNPATLDVFSFDFEADGAAMFLEYDGSSIHIFGTAFGGLDIGQGHAACRAHHQQVKDHVGGLGRQAGAVAADGLDHRLDGLFAEFLGAFLGALREQLGGP